MNAAPVRTPVDPPPPEDPEIFLAISDLELAGRGLADAVWHGLHRSLLRGPGVEFHSHRAYQNGDDLRRVNWQLFARHRKLFTRESRAESRRPVYLLLDATASMSVRHGPWSKLQYAMRALAGAAHLSRRQGDAPGLRILTDDSGAALPPRSSADHVSGICAALAGTPASGSANVAAALMDARVFCRQRGFILFVSDFLEQEDRILAELSALRAQGHDVFALQVLDPMEVELPESGDFDFLDPESGSRIKTAVEPLRAAYAARIAHWRTDLQREATSRGIRWNSVTTATPLTATLQEWFRPD